jgi:AAA15 family ATPase/GTPase
MITAIELENFRGFSKPVRIELAPVTLLFGTNSSGKTALLHAILFLHEVFVSKKESPVSERLKGASARRFERGQFDRKGMVHSDSGFLRKPSTGVGPWYVVWIWTKRRELSSYSLQG